MLFGTSTVLTGVPNGVSWFSRTFEVTPKLYVSGGYAFGNEGVADGNHYLVLALSWEAK